MCVGYTQLNHPVASQSHITRCSHVQKPKGDYYYGKNLAITSSSNTYLDGLGAIPENASRHDAYATSTSSDDDGAALTKRHDNCIYLWMSDYHPDGKERNTYVCVRICRTSGNGSSGQYLLFDEAEERSWTRLLQ